MLLPNVVAVATRNSTMAREATIGFVSSFATLDFRDVTAEIISID